MLPTQRRDEAEAALATARDAEDGARALWEMARNGARVEDKVTAEAMVARADGAVAEVDAFLAETSLASPIAGEVLRSNAEPGELVAAGMPVVTLVDLDDVWVTFNLREDRLPGIAMGSVLTGRLPALGGREVECSRWTTSRRRATSPPGAPPPPRAASTSRRSRSAPAPSAPCRACALA